MKKIDPIIRSITVSKKVKDIWIAREQNIIEVYKNKRKVATFDITKFNTILKI